MNKWKDDTIRFRQTRLNAAVNRLYELWKEKIKNTPCVQMRKKIALKVQAATRVSQNVTQKFH